MAKSTISNVKLGVFVTSGLAFLIFLLYMIGKKQNMFGSNFILKARFSNTQGLMQGGNVRFSGIEAGTVKAVNMINDTVIEVEMIVKSKMKRFIPKNAIASISTDGLMGDKLVNIIPVKEPAAFVDENDILTGKSTVNIADMLPRLQSTNNDVAIIAESLKRTVQQINNSTALWKILNDNTLPESLRQSLKNVHQTTIKAGEIVNDVQQMVAGVKQGNGSLGTILKDTTLAVNLNKALLKIQSVGDSADTLTAKINNMVQLIQDEVENGKGTANALLRDSVLVNKINNSMDNVEKGTQSFNENMEALKHTFLLKGYFRKQQKSKQSTLSNKVTLK